MQNTHSNFVTCAALVLPLVATLSACGGAGNAANDAQRESVPVPAKPLERVPARDAALTGEVPKPLLNLVYADLEALSGASAAEFEVLLSAFQEWPDGSMGCRRPDELFTQAPVRGYQVIVGVRGARYDYRVSERGRVQLCKPGRPLPGGNPPTQ